MDRAVVVTGGGRGVGRAIVERLLGPGRRVVVVESDTRDLEWLEEAVARGEAALVEGDAGDARTAALAADVAERDGVRLTGWVNNAAVFRDAWLHRDDPLDVLAMIDANLQLAVVGCGVAVRRMSVAGGGAIVNVSSHQAQRPVRGALPYATAKAAIEGLTRAVAVDHGAQGIRANAVALGSVVTERLTAKLDDATAAERTSIEAQLGTLHPLGRAGLGSEIAEAVAFLLSDAASWITGVVLPVDGGRAVRGPDPEARSTPDP